MKSDLKYSPEPEDKAGFTAYYDEFYSTFAAEVMQNDLTRVI